MSADNQLTQVIRKYVALADLALAEPNTQRAEQAITLGLENDNAPLSMHHIEKLKANSFPDIEDTPDGHETKNFLSQIERLAKDSELPLPTPVDSRKLPSVLESTRYTAKELEAHVAPVFPAYGDSQRTISQLKSAVEKSPEFEWRPFLLMQIAALEELQAKLKNTHNAETETRALSEFRTLFSLMQKLSESPTLGVLLSREKSAKEAIMHNLIKAKEEWESIEAAEGFSSNAETARTKTLQYITALMNCFSTEIGLVGQAWKANGDFLNLSDHKNKALAKIEAEIETKQRNIKTCEDDIRTVQENLTKASITHTLLTAELEAEIARKRQQIQDCHSKMHNIAILITALVTKYHALALHAKSADQMICALTIEIARLQNDKNECMVEGGRRLEALNSKLRDEVAAYEALQLVKVKEAELFGVVQEGLNKKLAEYKERGQLLAKEYYLEFTAHYAVVYNQYRIADQNLMDCAKAEQRLLERRTKASLRKLTHEVNAINAQLTKLGEEKAVHERNKQLFGEIKAQLDMQFSESCNKLVSVNLATREQRLSGELVVLKVGNEEDLPMYHPELECEEEFVRNHLALMETERAEKSADAAVLDEQIAEWKSELERIQSKLKLLLTWSPGA